MRVLVLLGVKMQDFPLNIYMSEKQNAEGAHHETSLDFGWTNQQHEFVRVITRCYWLRQHAAHSP